MNIKMVRGCICDSLTIDGKEEINLNDRERVEIIKKVSEHLKGLEARYLNELLQFLLEKMGKYSCSGQPCECCGDFVETYKVEI